MFSTTIRASIADSDKFRLVLRNSQPTVATAWSCFGDEESLPEGFAYHPSSGGWVRYLQYSDHKEDLLPNNIESITYFLKKPAIIHLLRGDATDDFIIPSLQDLEGFLATAGTSVWDKVHIYSSTGGAHQLSSEMDSDSLWNSIIRSHYIVVMTAATKFNMEEALNALALEEEGGKRTEKEEGGSRQALSMTQIIAQEIAKAADPSAGNEKAAKAGRAHLDANSDLKELVQKVHLKATVAELLLDEAMDISSFYNLLLKECGTLPANWKWGDDRPPHTDVRTRLTTILNLINSDYHLKNQYERLYLFIHRKDVVVMKGRHVNITLSFANVGSQDGKGGSKAKAKAMQKDA